MLVYTINLVDKIFLVYMLMLMVRIVGSWFPEIRGHQVMQFVSMYTDPYLNAFRRIIPPLGMLDLSPIVAFFALQFIEGIVKQTLVLLFS